MACCINATANASVTPNYYRKDEMKPEELMRLVDALRDFLLGEHAEGRHERCGKFCKAKL